MRKSLIPRKHRKFALSMIKEFKNNIGENDRLYKIGMSF